jgi:hypothetical protein
MGLFGVQAFLSNDDGSDEYISEGRLLLNRERRRRERVISTSSVGPLERFGQREEATPEPSDTLGLGGESIDYTEEGPMELAPVAPPARSTSRAGSRTSIGGRFSRVEWGGLGPLSWGCHLTRVSVLDLQLLGWKEEEEGDEDTLLPSRHPGSRAKGRYEVSGSTRSTRSTRDDRCVCVCDSVCLVCVYGGRGVVAMADSGPACAGCPCLALGAGNGISSTTCSRVGRGDGPPALISAERGSFSASVN